MEYAGMLFLLVFLVLHLLSQTLIPSVKGKNIALLVSSLIFYVWAGPIHLAILLVLTFIAWFFGLQIRQSGHPGQKKGLLIFSILTNVVCLIGFYYATFFLGTFRTITGSTTPLPSIVLPLGMTVYTLQLISYLADIYNGDLEPERSVIQLLTYSSLFYVSMGGPVLRYADTKKALTKRKVQLQNVSKGITRICIGAAKRYLLADSLAILVDQYLIRSAEGLSQVPVTGLWLGVILTAVRLYLRLSAYADVAVGLGQISGLTIPENFAYPLCSVSVTGFLSKWLISLGDFFRRYVEKPASRHKTRPLIGAAAAYMLMGLWLGGSWSYVLWGVFVAVCLRLEKRYIRRLNPVLSGILGIIGIFFSFVFLSFTTLPRLGIALRGLFGLGGNGFYRAEFFAGGSNGILLIIVSILFCIPFGTILHNLWRRQFQNNLLMMTLASVWEAAYPIGLLVLTAVWILRGSGTPFLTF